MNQVTTTESREAALAVIREQFGQAIAATKCHGCGCLAHTIETMEKAVPAVEELGSILAAARRVLVPRKYECLGCDVCFPAVAGNAFSEAFPDALGEAALCPTDTPTERTGWPPLPGEYTVVRYGAPVAVCTLNSDALAKELAAAAPEGLAIVGTMHTENLGIERVIRNVLANRNIRFLLLCGEDTRQLIGHLPGQSIESLCAKGVDEKRRIVGAKGKRPFLKNVSSEQIQVFREQVELVSMMGEQEGACIARTIADCRARGLPPFARAVDDVAVTTIHAREPDFYKSDPAGFLVVYPDAKARKLIVEHYTNAGVLNCVLDGTTPTALYMEIVKRGLVTQFDHAAYLGRELAAAERSLRTGEPYVQDRAPGVPLPGHDASEAQSCGPECPSCSTQPLRGSSM